MACDVYTEVTAQIIAALEAGTVPWRQPWKRLGLQRNLQSDRPYRGVNQLLLQLRGELSGYGSPFWTTYRAAQKAGGHVRLGEKGSLVTFWKFLDVRDSESNDAEPRRVPFLRSYKVFNTDQCEGLEIPELEPDDSTDFRPVAEAELVIERMPHRPEIAHGGDAAWYLCDLDRVQLPEPERFDPPEAYYATAFHELVHSTAHSSRLDRDTGSHRFGSADYSREELVAELGSAMLCGTVGIGPAMFENSAAYIANWLWALRDDKRMVVVAAGAAQRAADYILGEISASSGSAPSARPET